MSIELNVNLYGIINKTNRVWWLNTDPILMKSDLACSFISCLCHHLNYRYDISICLFLFKDIKLNDVDNSIGFVTKWNLTKYQGNQQSIRNPNEYL